MRFKPKLHIMNIDVKKCIHNVSIHINLYQNRFINEY